MDIVVVKNVSKKYGAKTVLDDVSFSIEKGTIFGLLGSNGAGKSTITAIMLGLEKTVFGKVTICGEDNPRKVRGKIALVPQETAFYKDFTVKENLDFFCSIENLKGKHLNQKVDHLINWLSLKEFRNIKTGFLSGGYQRLLNIALSLITDPEVLFMDEPTVGLDPSMRKLLWEKIHELKKGGMTIVLTTHYMDEAQKLCDKIALLKKGKLISIGTPDSLVKDYGGLRTAVLQVQNGLKECDLPFLEKIFGNRDYIIQNEWIFIPLKRGDNFSKVAELTEELVDKGYVIVSSTTREPNLEDVFINLTGEKFALEK